jgi:hypothetical protein
VAAVVAGVAAAAIMSLCSNPVGKNAAGNDVSVGLLVSRHRPARSMLTKRDGEDEDEDAGSSAAETDPPPFEEEEAKSGDAADTMGRKPL